MKNYLKIENKDEILKNVWDLGLDTDEYVGYLETLEHCDFDVESEIETFVTVLDTHFDWTLDERNDLFHLVVTNLNEEKWEILYSVKETMEENLPEAVRKERFKDWLDVNGTFFEDDPLVSRMYEIMEAA